MFQFLLYVFVYNKITHKAYGHWKIVDHKKVFIISIVNGTVKSK